MGKESDAGIFTEAVNDDGEEYNAVYLVNIQLFFIANGACAPSLRRHVSLTLR